MRMATVSQTCLVSWAGLESPAASPMSFQSLKFTLPEVWFEVKGACTGKRQGEGYKFFSSTL